MQKQDTFNEQVSPKYGRPTFHLKYGICQFENLWIIHWMKQNTENLLSGIHYSRFF